MNERNLNGSWPNKRCIRTETGETGMVLGQIRGVFELNERNLNGSWPNKRCIRTERAKRERFLANLTDGNK
ncbi:hypothetical protein [Robertmurraya siralis]|uniref:hypothetical protein n=1 Tax=Robertmurraya siralis TaxID=77777 RepID=UPI0010F8A897|nr:hypothetical protein [Robertmurraya siralis]